MDIIIITVVLLGTFIIFLTSEKNRTNSINKDNFKIVHAFRWAYGDNAWSTTVFLEDSEHKKRIYEGHSCMDPNKRIYDLWKYYKISTEQLIELIKQ